MLLMNRNKKSKLIFDFEEDEKGIMVTTKVRGKLTFDYILCVKELIDKKIKENVKNKRK